jgi:dihydrofolate synthase / folylpolyglutamate synthase
MSQSYESLITDLMGRWPESRIEPSLVRIASVVELLGDPQRAYPVIHVTGTNGKTSTARMVESLLRSMGLRTGLYTSPHLIDPRERIIFDGEPISVERFTRTWEDIAPYVELVDGKSVADGGIPLSFFEVMTAMAFAAFADAPVDVAIIEVGMGGTWDATNVADGVVNVITPIGLDHHEYLGDSIIEIANEKAGIITEGSVAILAAQDIEAAEILIERCAEVEAIIARQGVEFGVVSRDVAVGGQLLSLQGLHGRYDEIFLPLFGEHQAHNAAVALAATEAFIGNSELDPEIVREGFATVTSPGRLEILRRNPTIIVDAAHNPHGARALADAVDDSFEFSRLIGVIGMLEEKDATGILTALEPVLDQVVITSPRSPRALGAEDLADLAIEIFGEERVRCEVSLSAAIDTAVTVAEEEAMYGGVGVLVTGSVVLVGDAKRILGEAR